MESGITTDPLEIGAAVGTSIGADGERLLGILSPASYALNLGSTPPMVGSSGGWPTTSYIVGPLL